MIGCRWYFQGFMPGKATQVTSYTQKGNHLFSLRLIVNKCGGWASRWLVQGCVKSNVDGVRGCHFCVGRVVRKSLLDDWMQVVLS